MEMIEVIDYSRNIPASIGNCVSLQNELLEPAIKGTVNVLKSCAKVPSIKRVVLISSLAAVLFNGGPLTPNVITVKYIDETYFGISQNWYMLSKTLAEDAAWKFANENGIDLVAINPGWAISRPLQPTLNLHHRDSFEPHKWSNIPNQVFRFVDVRDVANAHILALERPSANGRYCLAAQVAHFSEFLKIVREYFPALHLPEN
ncbi:phenylacetaldehyde reductase [Jatropha curcas]|uniref:phenylacetaldehyde reductase n=1 Tax=Jatropha curcas TaxID=180498 RepID=UPI001893FC79|nr:phenylacetaldehyde reductase [Jatropha curcas]